VTVWAKRHDGAVGLDAGKKQTVMGLSLSRILAVLAKEFRQLRRDRLTFAMILGIPIMQLLLFGYAINTDPKHLPTAVLVQDQGDFSRSVIASLQNSQYFDIVQAVRTPAELDRLFDNGSVLFAVTIPGDFTRRVVRGEDPQILVEADASDPTATASGVAALSALPSYALMHDLKGPLASRAAVTAPFEVVVQRRYNPESITSYNIVPGLLGTILSMTLVIMTALGMTREAERGTMETLLATPLKPLEVMIGKLTPYVLIGIVQATLIIVMARILFGVPLAGGWGALVLGLFLFIVGSLSLGFLVSTVARNQLQAMQMAFFYFLPSILLSGFLFPFRGMPVWAQWIGTLVPVTHMLRVVRGAMLKGVGISGSLESLGALGLFMLIVAALAVRQYRTTLD
jgi:ABC-2 type transport system permease protein